MSILRRCRETPNSKPIRMKMRRDRAPRFPKGQAQFELVDLIDGRNFSPRAHNVRALQAPRDTH